MSIAEVEIRAIGDDDLEAVVALNNASKVETSELDAASMAALVGSAHLTAMVPPGDALLIVMDQDSAYDSPNFLWFKDRYPRFVYVDRIVVGAAARGRGLAKRLYLHLFEAARAAGHDRVCCEVNRVPPNPGSDAFHAALGFEEVGRAELQGGAKTVRYLERRLD